MYMDLWRSGRSCRRQLQVHTRCSRTSEDIRVRRRRKLHEGQCTCIEARIGCRSTKWRAWKWGRNTKLHRLYKRQYVSVYFQEHTLHYRSLANQVRAQGGGTCRIMPQCMSWRKRYGRTWYRMARYRSVVIRNFDTGKSLEDWQNILVYRKCRQNIRFPPCLKISKFLVICISNLRIFLPVGYSTIRQSQGIG